MGTNTICTPFSYDGVTYDECTYNFGIGYWCLTNGQTGSRYDYSYCGECLDPIATFGTGSYL